MKVKRQHFVCFELPFHLGTLTSLSTLLFRAEALRFELRSHLHHTSHKSSVARARRNAMTSADTVGTVSVGAGGISLIAAAPLLIQSYAARNAL